MTADDEQVLTLHPLKPCWQEPLCIRTAIYRRLDNFVPLPRDRRSTEHVHVPAIMGGQAADRSLRSLRHSFSQDAIGPIHVDDELEVVAPEIIRAVDAGP